MIFSHVVYDAQFSFVTIYKVGKCMMPSVLKICSDFKSCVVYSSLKWTNLNEPFLQNQIQDSLRWMKFYNTKELPNFMLYVISTCLKTLSVQS